MTEHRLSERIDDFLGSDCRCHDGTWRDWIRDVLVAFEDKVEGFSGKRPLGESGWHLSLAEGLTAVDPKIGTAEYDEHGFLDRFDPDYVRVSKAWQAVVERMLR